MGGTPLFPKVISEIPLVVTAALSEVSGLKPGIARKKDNGG
jgi:hypothetical protein